jgi:uncharacterized caspase-like protein
MAAPLGGSISFTDRWFSNTGDLRTEVALLRLEHASRIESRSQRGGFARAIAVVQSVRQEPWSAPPEPIREGTRWMRQRTISLLVLLAVALATEACIFGVADFRLRSASVEPVPIPIGLDARPASIAARLAPVVHGLRESTGATWGEATWAAAYQGGNTIIASMRWGTHYLEVAIRVDKRVVNIAVVKSVRLNQRNGKIHRNAAAYLQQLRQTISSALRTEGAAFELAAAAEEQARRYAAEPSSSGRQQGTNDPDVRPERAEYGRYFALIVGNDHYAELPDLRTALSDAVGVSRVLEDEYEFEVELLANAKRAKIVSALNRYRTRLGVSDNLLLYYAGHGWFDEEAQRGYWLPADAAKRDPANWISNATVTDLIKAIPAKHVIVVADSCYSGTLTRGVKVRHPDAHLGALASKRARTVLTSGGLEPVEDGTGRHSVFAAAFIRTLRENETVLDGQTLFASLRRPVMLAVDQTPEYADIRRAGHEGGDFLFVPARLQRTAP